MWISDPQFELPQPHQYWLCSLQPETQTAESAPQSLKKPEPAKLRFFCGRQGTTRKENHHRTQTHCQLLEASGLIRIFEPSVIGLRRDRDQQHRRCGGRKLPPLRHAPHCWNFPAPSFPVNQTISSIRHTEIFKKSLSASQWHSLSIPACSDKRLFNIQPVEISGHQMQRIDRIHGR